MGDPGKSQKGSSALPVTEHTAVILIQILFLFFSLSLCHKSRDNNKSGFSALGCFIAFPGDFPLWYNVLRLAKLLNRTDCINGTFINTIYNEDLNVQSL